MSGSVKSHPHLYLHEHIEQIKKAMDYIFKRHSQDAVSSQHKKILEKVALLHDIGKGTSAFQKYIDDPPQYKDDPIDKTHTLLSLLLTLVVLQKENWETLDALVLAAVVLGHHSGLPTIPEKKIGGVDGSERDIDNFAGGEKARLLARQLNMINYEALNQEIGINLNEVLLNDKNEMGKIIRNTKRFLLNKVISKFSSLNIAELIQFRLKTQLVFSIFLEADKAFLAVTNPDLYSERKDRIWQSQWIEQRIGIPYNTPTNRLRHEVRNEIVTNLNDGGTGKVYSLTAPTGSGKTLLAATWAFKMRELIETRLEFPPKVIVVLPYLSVIDQTAKEYRKLLEIGGNKADGSWLLTSHSLSDRYYASWLEEEDSRFFIDTWRTELIITTYDQFLMSLMDAKARYQMRFHNLCDALIIMDEVQSLPCKLWQPLEAIFEKLVEVGNSNILLMSATLPPFVTDAKPLLSNYKKYFKKFKRYKICFRLYEPLNIQCFCKEVQERLSDWLENGKRILITLNTRGSAREVRDALEYVWSQDYTHIPLFFISADVTPKDRLEAIELIKEGKPCVVVSTQCIEAGVDIDMDMVIRDFAPLDSLIQVAGRCNREGGHKEHCIVEIIDLTNDNNNRYSEMIYDETHLQVTRELIGNDSEIYEENILDLAELFFKELFNRKDTGKKHLDCYAKWQDDITVHELLRGKQRLQYTFLVIEQDQRLLEDMDVVSQIEDRWERREGWKKLAGRIAMISINVFAQQGFSPAQIADEHFNHLWILREGHYSSECGLLVEGKARIL